jgi:RNA polymerase sigma-32 factor
MEISTNIDYSKPKQDIDDIKNYINGAKKCQLLSRKDEQEIAMKAIVGDRKSINKLIEANLLLVVKIAHEYNNIFNNIDDLIQEGNVGICRAVAKYDPSFGYRFSTYASYWIKSMMLRYIFNNRNMIKGGTTNEHKKLFYNLRKEQRRLSMLGIDADVATIAKSLDVSEKSVVEMDRRLHSDIYLDAPVMYADGDDSNVSFSDCMMAPIEKRPDIETENDDYNDMIRGKLNTFGNDLKNDRQREIFYKRIINDEPMTLQEIGDKYKISRERSRQIEKQIKIKLKQYLTAIIEA